MTVLKVIGIILLVLAVELTIITVAVLGAILGPLTVLANL